MFLREMEGGAANNNMYLECPRKCKIERSKRLIADRLQTPNDSLSFGD